VRENWSQCKFYGELKTTSQKGHPIPFFGTICVQKYFNIGFLKGQNRISFFWNSKISLKIDHSTRSARPQATKQNIMKRNIY
jgi:hypothetical protein